MQGGQTCLGGPERGGQGGQLHAGYVPCPMDAYCATRSGQPSGKLVVQH